MSSNWSLGVHLGMRRGSMSETGIQDRHVRSALGPQSTEAQNLRWVVKFRDGNFQLQTGKKSNKKPVLKSMEVTISSGFVDQVSGPLDPSLTRFTVHSTPYLSTAVPVTCPPWLQIAMLWKRFQSHFLSTAVEMQFPLEWKFKTNGYLDPGSK